MLSTGPGSATTWWSGVLLRYTWRQAYVMIAALGSDAAELRSLQAVTGCHLSAVPSHASASRWHDLALLQETNHHETYAALVDALGDATLGKMLLNTTYKYIRTLLVSPHLKTKSGERSLLRNLGSWLGRLTLARQQPIRQRDLDLKQIMYEAYEQGKMIAVMPFLVKVRTTFAVLLLARRLSCCLTASHHCLLHHVHGPVP